MAASIEGDAALSMEAIRTEIDTLGRVAKAAGRATRQQRPQGLVPRAAASGVQRTMPSLVTQDAPITSVAGSVGAADSDAEDIYL